MHTMVWPRGVQLARQLELNETMEPRSMVEKAQRKSFTREFKLNVIRYYQKNNLYRTSKCYELNTKTILRWIKQESKIKDASKQSKHLKHQQKVMHPEMEEKLYDEYKKLCKKGLKVKGYWFKLRSQ